jgi:hydroxymethylpyrimidine kinase/phosphomethylpyrimidine kinase
MVSTSGAQLLPEKAVATMLSDLFPVITILTPNLPEAQLLLRTAMVPYQEPQTPEDLISMAKSLQQLGPKFVLLKGGHMPLTKDRRISRTVEENHVVLNVLAGPEGVETFETEYLESKNTHGTGCSLACEFMVNPEVCLQLINIYVAAIACNIANGLTITAAVKAGNRYVEAGIKASRDIGKGSGPINHFHSTYALPFTP